MRGKKKAVRRRLKHLRLLARYELNLKTVDLTQSPPSFTAEEDVVTRGEEKESSGKRKEDHLWGFPGHIHGVS